ncbi:39S ribosomal protein L18, mitochondrial isoform X4 [Ursus americanus]|uniref:39S ribosomal protein L18, mitochondrial isoform X4 n=1 Tax=Ursus americanus TaxID=9643 RepID=UPI001E67B1D0|nr:39S ribosomal protein L18, mitochondrial isoform X4 [Ursus americanus]
MSYGCGRRAAGTPMRREREAFPKLCPRSLSDGPPVAALAVAVGLQEPWLRVIRTQHHVEALVEHRNGQVVVSASTREWAIKKHLYSTKNVVACESIGRVLAERCLEAGINFMVYQPTPWEAASDSMKRLQSAMTEGGVVLQEPRRIYE